MRRPQNATRPGGLGVGVMLQAYERQQSKATVDETKLPAEPRERSARLSKRAYDLIVIAAGQIESGNERLGLTRVQMLMLHERAENTRQRIRESRAQLQALARVKSRL